MLFGTNISNELFEFGKAVKATTRDLKAQLERNVGAIFADDETREWVRKQVTKFPVHDLWKLGVNKAIIYNALKYYLL